MQPQSSICPGSVICCEAPWSLLAPGVEVRGLDRQMEEEDPLPAAAGLLLCAEVGIEGAAFGGGGTQLSAPFGGGGLEITAGELLGAFGIN